MGRVDRAEVTLQRVPGDLAEGAGQLRPGRACADHDERHPFGATNRVGLPLGGLERNEDPASDLGGVLDRLEPGSVLRPAVIAEVREAGSRRDDQRVVARSRPPSDRTHLALVGIEPDGLAEQDGRVLPLPQDRAERLGDVAGTDGAGRDLVQERLEQVEIAPIDERDVDPAGPFPAVGRRTARQTRRR